MHSHFIWYGIPLSEKISPNFRFTWFGRKAFNGDYKDESISRIFQNYKRNLYA